MLYQNLNALYFFYPARPNYINMHHVFWAMFALMALYALSRGPGRSRQQPSELELSEPRLSVGALALRRGSRACAHHLPRRLREQREDDGDGEHAVAGLVVVAGAVPRAGSPAVTWPRLGMPQVRRLVAAPCLTFAPAPCRSALASPSFSRGTRRPRAPSYRSRTHIPGNRATSGAGCHRACPS